MTLTLDSSLTIAAGGLANINSQLAVVSQNVSNANTAGYTLELGQQTALSAGGVPMGVFTDATVRSINTMLQTEARQQNATVAAMTVRSQALSAINAAHGTPGNGDDLASLTGALSDAFTTLSANPSTAVSQTAVVTAAQNLAGGINRVAQAISTQRQSAQNSASQEITQLNAALASIGTLSTQISSLTNQGASTAAVADQRDAAMNTVSQLTGASFFTQSNGNVQVILPSGTTLPTDGSANLQLTDQQLNPQNPTPPITLNGQDITAQFTGGQIGANLALRDTELPTFQAELDELSNNLSQRFAAAGLNLFTDPSPPAVAANASVQASYLGLAGRLQVNPAVVSNSALVQRGTNPALPGTVTGANDQTIINNVLNFALGTNQGDLTTLQSTLVSDLQSNATALPANVSTDIQAVTTARATVAAAGASLATDTATLATAAPGLVTSATAVASARAAVTTAQAQVYLDQVTGSANLTADQTALATAQTAAATAVTAFTTAANTGYAANPQAQAAATQITQDWTNIDTATATNLTPAMTQLATDVTAAGSSAVTSAVGTIVGDWNAIDAATAAIAAAGTPRTQGLGLSGTLSIPFAVPPTLAVFAANVVSVQTGASSDVSANLATAQAAQTTLNNSVAAVSGVSIDTEMSTMIGLQNAYAANARVITAVQSMWTSLLNIGTGA